MGQALAAQFAAGAVQNASAGGGPSGGPQNPETTWWCRLLARIVGTVGGLGNIK